MTIVGTEKQYNRAALVRCLTNTITSCQQGTEPKHLTIQRESGIKQPGLKTKNQQRPSTNKKDERDITPLRVHLQIVYRTVALSHAAKKRDVGYGDTLKIVSQLVVLFFIYRRH